MEGIQVSGKVNHIVEVCKYFAKYEPESDRAGFFKYIVGGLSGGNVVLLVYLDEKEEFKGGVVITIMPDFLYIDFAYIDQHIEGLSLKVMDAVVELAKSMGKTKIRTKAVHHLKAANEKFGFIERFTILEKDLTEEDKGKVVIGG